VVEQKRRGRAKKLWKRIKDGGKFVTDRLNESTLAKNLPDQGRRECKVTNRNKKAGITKGSKLLRNPLPKKKIKHAHPR